MRVEIGEIVLDPLTGKPLQGASVQVFPRDAAQIPANYAAVYNAASGGAAITQPLYTDAQGRIEGWVEQGRYDLLVGGPDGYTQRWEATTFAAHWAGPATLAYDSQGRLSSAVTPGGTVDQITYDAQGRIASVRDNGMVRNFTYDAISGALTAVS